MTEGFEQPPTEWRHAPGFGQYVRATAERQHRPPSAYYDARDERWYCSECAFPVRAVLRKPDRQAQ